MRKEIAPELYNYNKFPGPEFRQIGTKILTETIEFDLVENFKEGFDIMAFNQRFSEILTKFDYIVGDWGNEQLRLRGFYKDDKANESEEKISRLEDYLLEYCNYGCAYFVLENLKPRRASFDKNLITKRKMKPNHAVLSKLGPIRNRSNPSEKIASAVSDKIKSKEQESKIQRSNNKQAASAILSFVKNSGNREWKSRGRK